MSNDFFEKYKDPRWQKKRLEIMEKSDFSCDNCGEDSETLAVHHKYYIADNDPWDYKDEVFITYCENCHDEEHKSKKEFEVMLKTMKLIFTFEELSEILRGILSECNSRDRSDLSDPDIIPTDYIVKGVGSGKLAELGKNVFDEKLAYYSKINATRRLNEA